VKTDFEHWLAAQFADTGAFTVFIVLVRIDGERVAPVMSSFAQMIGDEMDWREMQQLLDGARRPWDGVGFFVGLSPGGGPLPDDEARSLLKQVEADVQADPLALNRGLLFDREGRHLRIDEVH
jgi:hypothetical protein